MAEPDDSHHEGAPTPRWLYAVGALVILGALAFVAMHLASGGLVTH